MSFSSPLTPIASPSAPLGPTHGYFRSKQMLSDPASHNPLSPHRLEKPSHLVHSHLPHDSAQQTLLEGTAAATGFSGKDITVHPFPSADSPDPALMAGLDDPLRGFPSSSAVDAGTTAPHGGHAGVSSTWHVGLRNLGRYVGDPVNLKFLAVCSLWYVCSSLTNNTDKIILNSLPFPATLTYFQFVLAVPFSLIFSPLFGFTKLVPPSLNVVKIAIPFCLFRILGHVSASVSLWLVPVSYAHTVKALGPLFSVFLSKVILGTSFSNLTYLSLVPLISGVILATATEINFNVMGTVAALFSVFVLSLQSIYSKKLFVSQALDEANLLYHTSLLSALVLTPYWLFYEAGEIDWSEVNVNTSLFVLFNGLTQYGQCICAFSVVALTSPVTYSIASLFKRVFVIVLALLWFGNPVSLLNLLGIMITFFGLYLYQKSRISEHKAHGKDRSYSPNGITSTSSDMLMRSSSSIFNTAKDRLPIHTAHGRTGFS